MTYEEAREKMFEVCGFEFFTMGEVVPERPLEHGRPTYQVTTFCRGQLVMSVSTSSWKKAVTDLAIQVSEIVAQMGVEDEHLPEVD